MRRSRDSTPKLRQKLVELPLMHRRMQTSDGPEIALPEEFGVLFLLHLILFILWTNIHPYFEESKVYEVRGN